MNKPLTPLELQLQQYIPAMFALHMLMKDELEGGGGERKMAILIDTLLEYNTSKATGKIFIDFSKGKIANVDATIRLAAGTALPKSRE